ncbi:MAG: hypothetical protein II951_06495 [Bacteroidales bacterium]|nr:hypothetical protein [Bacteroidales bacterium]
MKIISRILFSLSALSTLSLFSCTPTPDVVDLGLSVKWASMNLGAECPEDYGSYYQWATTEPVDSTARLSLESYKFYKTSSDKDAEGFSKKKAHGFNKYVPKSEADDNGFDGFSDDLNTIALEDDAAFAALGENWRVPSLKEWRELEDSCTWVWCALNNVDGYKVTSNVAGFTDKWIFIPAAGYKGKHVALISSDFYDRGDKGCYWCDSVSVKRPAQALSFEFTKRRKYDELSHRHMALPIRPVFR